MTEYRVYKSGQENFTVFADTFTVAQGAGNDIDRVTFYRTEDQGDGTRASREVAFARCPGSVWEVTPSGEVPAVPADGFCAALTADGTVIRLGKGDYAVGEWVFEKYEGDWYTTMDECRFTAAQLQGWADRHGYEILWPAA